MVVFGKKWLYSGKVVVLWQTGCLVVKVVVFGQKRLYSVKVVVFGQIDCIRARMVVLSQSGSFRAKWLSSGKEVVFVKKLL